jgi:hypothetical protein
MISAKEAQKLSRSFFKRLDNKIRRAALTGKDSVTIVIPRHSWSSLEKEIKDAGYNYGYGPVAGNDKLLKIGISWSTPTM